MNVPKCQLHLDAVFAMHAIKKVQLGLHIIIIFFGCFVFPPHSQAHKHPHDPASLTFFFFVLFGLEHSLHVNHSLSDDEAI